MKIIDFNQMNFKKFTPEENFEFGVYYAKILGYEKFLEQFLIPVSNGERKSYFQSLINKFLPNSNDIQIKIDKSIYKGTFRILYENVSFSEPNIDSLQIESVVSKYILTFGNDKFMEIIIRDLINLIFQEETNTVKQIFKNKITKIDYKSYDSLEFEQVKNKLISEIILLNSDNYPLTILLFQITDFDSKFMIAPFEIFHLISPQDQKKVENNSSKIQYFYSNKQELIREINNIQTKPLPIRLILLHRKPKDKHKPTNLEFSNDNQPIKKAA